MKKNLVYEYGVTFYDSDDKSTMTYKVMDGKSLACMDMDWAFTIVKVVCFTYQRTLFNRFKLVSCDDISHSYIR